MPRALRSLSILAAAGVLASCAGVQYPSRSPADIAALASAPLAYPAVRFAVLSDPHLFDVGLGAEGPAFQEYMDNDRKLLPWSAELLQAAVAAVKASGVRFLLIPGDLTKDGEKQDHELMAAYLAELERAGISAWVVPGNHDILNPRAMRFTATGQERVPWVTPDEFAAIYRDVGYGEAVERDPSSLSYVAEPVPGLRLLAICSADYTDNPRLPSPRTAGRISEATSRWIERVLGDSLAAGKPVIVMMHHGVVEHHAGQARYYGQYLVRDFPAVADLLAAYGVRVVFTGHYHAQDIAERRWEDGRFLFVVETGSLVTYPDPYRIVEIAAGRLAVRSDRIASLPSFAARDEDFGAYSLQFAHAGIAEIAVRTARGLGVPQAEAATIAPQIADAVVAHCAGDERFTGTEMLTTRGLGFMGRLIVDSRGDLVAGLWNDLPPADSDVSVDLATGAWSPLQ